MPVSEHVSSWIKAVAIGCILVWMLLGASTYPALRKASEGRRVKLCAQHVEFDLGPPTITIPYDELMISGVDRGPSGVREIRLNTSYEVAVRLVQYERMDELLSTLETKIRESKTSNGGVH